MNKCNYESKLFKIAKSLHATNFLVNKIAFQPPTNAFYSISKVNPSPKQIKSNFFSTENYDIIYEECLFCHDIYTNIDFKWIELECYQIQRIAKNTKINEKNSKDVKYNQIISKFLSNKSGKKIVVLMIKNKIAKYTIIFSHGNSSTIGTMYPYLVDMSTQLKANIIIYDYQGYGKSEGKATETNIYLDIETVMEFILLKKIFSTDDYILYGHSLGSAPTIHLACTELSKNIKAIILLSPLASGLNLIHEYKENKGLEKHDVFCNIKKIREVICPIFLIHGKKDDIIPFKNCEQMAKYIKIKHEWYPKNGDHCNILTKYRTKFFSKLKTFLNKLEYLDNKQYKLNINECRINLEKQIRQKNDILKDRLFESNTNFNILNLNNIDKISFNSYFDNIKVNCVTYETIFLNDDNDSSEIIRYSANSIHKENAIIKEKQIKTTCLKENYNNSLNNGVGMNCQSSDFIVCEDFSHEKINFVCSEDEDKNFSIFDYNDRKEFD